MSSVRHNGVRNSSILAQAFPASVFSMVCSSAGLGDLFIKKLEAFDCRYSSSAQVTLLIDHPYGFALDQLETTDWSDHHSIVVTGNTCPEYVADLCDQHPDILLVGKDLDWEIVLAVKRAQHGEQYRTVPCAESRLKPNERAILRLTAFGLEVAEVAQKLGLAPKTVRNKLSDIYTELELRNCSDATRYYFNIQTFFPNT